MADRGRVGSLVVGCKSAAQRQWRREHDAHRSRVRLVKPSTDMSVPVTLGMEHLRSNLKKERLLEDRYMEIDRENQVLLRKMSDAMKKPNSYIQEPPECRPTSLNRQGRKKELLRITQENQRMLRAIQNVQPAYSHKRWEEDFRRSEVLLKNCSAYPVVTRLTRDRSAPSVLMRLSPDPLDAEGSNHGASPSGSDHQDVEAPSGHGRGGFLGSDDRRVVMKEGKRIGDAYFLVEMSTDGRALHISAYNGETQQSLELIVKEKNHRQLYRESNGDYSQIAARLRIFGDRLVLEAAGSPDSSGG